MRTFSKSYSSHKFRRECDGKIASCVRTGPIAAPQTINTHRAAAKAGAIIDEPGEDDENVSTYDMTVETILHLLRAGWPQVCHPICFAQHLQKTVARFARRPRLVTSRKIAKYDLHAVPNHNVIHSSMLRVGSNVTRRASFCMWLLYSNAAARSFDPGAPVYPQAWITAPSPVVRPEHLPHVDRSSTRMFRTRKTTRDASLRGITSTLP